MQRGFGTSIRRFNIMFTLREKKIVGLPLHLTFSSVMFVNVVSLRKAVRELALKKPSISRQFFADEVDKHMNSGKTKKPLKCLLLWEILSVGLHLSALVARKPSSAIIRSANMADALSFSGLSRLYHG